MVLYLNKRFGPLIKVVQIKPVVNGLQHQNFKIVHIFMAF